jgi:hypothetical protein
VSPVGFLLFVLAFAAGVVFLYELYRSQTSNTTPALIAFLGSLGLTAGSTWAAVQKAFAQAEAPLWEAEVGAAAAEVAWQGPDKLAKVEDIELLILWTGQNDEVDARLHHPRLTRLRNFPVGRIAMVLTVAGLALAIAVGTSPPSPGWVDASFFIAPFALIGFMAVVAAWDLLATYAAREGDVPYLTLPERIALPDWLAPLQAKVAPLLAVIGLLLAHFLWH